MDSVMPAYKAPLNDIRFLLHKVFKLESFCAQFPSLSDVDHDTVNAIIDEAGKLSEQVLATVDASGNKEGCKWEDGNVTAAAGFKDAYKTLVEGGWGALGGDPDYGGMGMPKTLVSTVEEMIQGANMSLGLAPMLTAGACLSLHAHGSDTLKGIYLAKMYSGEWSGAMDLTEAHAGTDLGLMRTKAQPQDDGSYHISGSKIFITWGEHDLTENIIHLVLAKLPDAPAGSRGISLFLVPKFLVNSDGDIGERNTLSCGSIEHKMGIHGSATCVMNFDGAKGWLVGEPNAGLAAMFTMMNYERLVVGIQGIGVAEASYQCARDYALERRQGRASSKTDQAEVASPIICHPDVRRMLLEMKSLNEASRAFYIYVASWLDRAKFSQTEQERTCADERIALLTPVAKAFITDRAFDVAVIGQQVLGGHGYIAEWGQEQKVRDVRITQIYEGTNGIQAMDLAGRKTCSCNASLLQAYLQEMRAASARISGQPVDHNLLVQFDQAVTLLDKTTQQLISQQTADLIGCAAVDYLNLVGYVSFAYMWVLMLEAVVDDEYLNAQSKQKTAQFYFSKILPRAATLSHVIAAGSEPVMGLDSADF